LLRRAFVLLFFSACTFPRQPGQYFMTITAQSLSLIALSGFMLAITRWREIHSIMARIPRLLAHHREVRPAIFLGSSFALFVTACAATSLYCFNGFPTYTDSVAQYIQAKFMAHGELVWPSHPLREFFPVWMMVNDGKWYAQYQPLQPFLIAIGMFAGIPWIVNPVLGGLTILVIYAITRRIYGEGTAKIAVLLTMTSHFIWIVSSEYMNHAPALLFCMLFIYCFFEMQDAKDNASDRRWWALAAGISLGLVILLRPVTALCLAIPFAIYGLTLLKQDRKTYFLPLFIMGTATTVCLLVNLWTNYIMAGDMFMFPSAAYHRRSTLEALGFKNGLTLNLMPLIKKMHEEWWMMNIHLFQWSLPCTFFVALLFFFRVKHTRTRLLLCVVISLALGEIINQFRNLIFGPRYIYETAGPLIILTAAGLRRLVALLAALKLAKRKAALGIVAVPLLICIMASLVFVLPGNVRRYAGPYMDSHKGFYRTMYAQSVKPALIFVGRVNPGDNVPKDHATLHHRRIAFTNPPRDDAEIIFAIDLGDKRNQKLMDYYPDRTVYLEIMGKLKLVRRPLTPPSP
jgi:hypothetical protein